MHRPHSTLIKWTISILVTTIAVLPFLCCPFLGPPAPDRSFTTKDVLVGLSDLPPGWSVSYGPDKALQVYRGEESAEIRFSAGSPYGVAHSVNRYKNAGVAEGVYQDFVLPGAWGKPPGEWTYKSGVADQSIFSCYDYEGREPPICMWAARYEEYVVQFHARLIAGQMSLRDIERIIKVIDQRIAQYLGKK